VRDPVLKGHPLHAMLSDVPIGALITSVVMDALWLAHPAETWRMAAEVALFVTVCGASLAALAGLWDWLSIPNEHESKTAAAYHGWINGAGLALLIASLFVHWRFGAAVGPMLSFAGFAVAVAAAWIGGDVVFRQGWRVRPAEWDEQLEAELRKEGDAELIRKVHETVRAYERDHTLLP